MVLSEMPFNFASKHAFAKTVSSANQGGAGHLLMVKGAPRGHQHLSWPSHSGRAVGNEGSQWFVGGAEHLTGAGGFSHSVVACTMFTVKAGQPWRPRLIAFLADCVLLCFQPFTHVCGTSVVLQMLSRLDKLLLYILTLNFFFPAAKP